MTFKEILLPLFVQVLLTLAVVLILAWRRFAAVRQGEVRGPISLRERNWPEGALQAEFNYQNQFELPVLFYVLMILLLVTRLADIVLIVLAWIFVALRLVHAFVHLTSNKVALRGPLFITGAAVLAVMWGVFMLRVIAA